MDREDFVQQMRESRGKLTRYTRELEDIYENGIPALLEFSLTKKLMGVKNIQWISLQDGEYQERFCNFMEDKNWKADKNELDLWFSQNPGVTK